MSLDKKLSIVSLTFITLLLMLMHLSDQSIASYIFLLFMFIFPLTKQEFKVSKLIFIFFTPLFIFLLLLSYIRIRVSLFYEYEVEIVIFILILAIFFIFYTKYIRDKFIFLLKAILVLSIPVLLFILISQYLHNSSAMLDYIVNFNGLFRSYLRFFVNPETSYIYFTIVLVILTVIRHRYTIYLYLLLVVSQMIYLGTLSSFIEGKYFTYINCAVVYYFSTTYFYVSYTLLYRYLELKHIYSIIISVLLTIGVVNWMIIDARESKKVSEVVHIDNCIRYKHRGIE